MAQKKSKEGREEPLGTIHRLELVRYDIVPRGSSRRSLLFFVPYFSARLDFPLPPLSAPGSPRII